MREITQRLIKFRGLYQNESDGRKTWVYYGIGTKPVVIGAHWCVEDLQFTGQHDKNKKEVFEGDIVIVSWQDIRNSKIVRSGEYLSEVKWGSYSDGEYVYNVECWLIDNLPLSEAGQGGSYEHDAFKVEVIGNIYESPELLKEP